MTKKIAILPKWVDYKKLYAGWHFAGAYRCRERIKDWAPGSQWPEDLPVVIDIEEAAGGRLLLRLGADANASLECQRCREPLEWDEQIAQELVLVESEEQARGELHWLIDEDRVFLQDLVESELSLALPDFPRHRSC